jgi:hypothetical protein
MRLRSVISHLVLGVVGLIVGFMAAIAYVGFVCYG